MACPKRISWKEERKNNKPLKNKIRKTFILKIKLNTHSYITRLFDKKKIRQKNFFVQII